LRLGENRRLNKDARFSPRRKDGAIYFLKTIIPLFSRGRTGHIQHPLLLDGRLASSLLAPCYSAAGASKLLARRIIISAPEVI